MYACSTVRQCKAEKIVHSLDTQKLSVLRLNLLKITKIDETNVVLNSALSKEREKFLTSTNGDVLVCTLSSILQIKTSDSTTVSRVPFHSEYFMLKRCKSSNKSVRCF